MSGESPDLVALLRAADRKVMGAEFARRIGDVATADRIDDGAVVLYTQALALDPNVENAAWRDASNRDPAWLERHGLSRILKPGQ